MTRSVGTSSLAPAMRANVVKRSETWTDVLGVRARLDDARPADVGVHADAAFENVGLAAAVDAVRYARDAGILHERAVVPHDDDDRVVSDAQSVHLGNDLADPLIDLDDALGDRAAVERPGLANVVGHEGERKQRPVVQEERLMLLGQRAKLFERVALVALIHLAVFLLRPLLARLQIDLVQLAVTNLDAGWHVARVGHEGSCPE